MATDSGNPAKTATAQVCFTITGDKFTPDFGRNPYNVTINEDKPLNELVERVTAIDNDVGSNVRYSIVGNYPGPSFFNITPSTGEIRVANDVRNDNLRMGSYQLRVKACDPAHPDNCGFTNVNINVNRNLHQPVFTPSTSYISSVNDTIPVGTPIETIRATDSDKGDKVTYNISGASPGNCVGHFQIDPVSGQVINKNLLTGLPNQCLLTVTATDSRGRSGNAILTVNIQHDLNKPTFSPSTTGSNINEKTGLQTQVCNGLLATDLDRKGLIVYELVGDNQAQIFFSIDRNTGIIRVVRDLQTDVTRQLTYSLRIAAYDTVYPTNIGYGICTVNVVRNANPPQFVQTLYSARVNDTEPPGTVLTKVTATDLDGDNITYSIRSCNNGRDNFYIHPTDGTVYLVKKVTVRTVNRFTCTIDATDSGNPSQTSTATVVIDVSTVVTTTLAPRTTIVTLPPVSTHPPPPIATKQTTTMPPKSTTEAPKAPVFNPNSYTFPVRETDALNHPAGTVTSTVNKGSVRYRMVGDAPGMGMFAVNPTTGQVYISDPTLLRKDTRTTYNLKVEGCNTLAPAQCIVQPVTITVTRNIKSPAFGQPSYSTNVGQVCENKTLGDPLLKVTATDADGDAVTYSLAGTPTVLQYVALLSDGTLILKKSLDQTGITALNFNVVASDGRGKTATVPVNIPVCRFTQPPRYTGTIDPSVSVDETAPPGFSVTTLTATDPDLQGKLQYIVRGTGTAPSFFSVDQNTGVIKVSSNLKMETSPNPIKLLVGVSDTKRPNQEVTSTVTININRNLNAPTFNPKLYQKSISDQVVVSTPIEKVTATDLDNDVLRYSITGDARAQQYFYIDAQTGQIYSKLPLTNLGGNNIFNIQVGVSDQRNPEKRDTATVTVTVNPTTPVIDQPPRFVQSNNYSITINENEPVNGRVLPVTVQANDPDLKQRLVYELKGIYPSGIFFSVDPNNAQIRVIRSLKNDPMQLNRYVLEIHAYDAQFPNNRAKTFLIVNVNRNVNPPQFGSGLYTKSIPETFELVKDVICVNATDSDGDRITYSLSLISPANTLDYFYVDTTNGCIRLKKSMMGTAPTNLYQMNIIASDNRNPAKTASATARITITRNSPVFSLPNYAKTLPESQPLGNVLNVTATDADLKGTIVYEAIGVAPATDFFNVDRNTGDIRLTKDLKSATQNTLTLRIQAYDTLNPSDKKTTDVVYTITRPTNANSPRFTSRSLTKTIAEDAQLATNIIDAVANDADGDIVRYTITGNTVCQTYLLMDPATGKVTLKASLLGKGITQLNCQLRAGDQRTPEKFDTIPLTVTVTAIARFPIPALSPAVYTKEIPENKQLNTNVVNVIATIPSGKGSPVCTEVSSPPAAALFNVISPCQVVVAQNLANDRSTDKFNLQVKVCNSLDLTKCALATVFITVNRNLNPPDFGSTDFVFTINETQVPGKIIGNVKATDMDTWQKLSYSITTDATLQAFFSINSLTGDIILAKSVMPSATTTSQFRGTVAAQDDGEPIRSVSSNLVINVLRNQYSPVFTKPQYDVRIVDTVNPGVNIDTIVATDQDLKGVIRYRVDGRFPGTAFLGVRPDTGQVYVKLSLKADPFNSLNYTLDVVAYDTAVAYDIAKSKVFVTVVRNPNAPTFPQNLYRRTVSEQLLVGAPIVSLNATDKDGDNVVYSIGALSSQTCKDYFTIDRTTGEFQLRRTLLKTTVNQYQCTVLACDDRTPSKCSPPTVIEVTVTRQAKHRVEWLNLPYDSPVREDKSIGYVVRQVRAEDVLSNTGNIHYTMRGFAPGNDYFSLDLTSGEIKIKKLLSTDNTPVYMLQLVAYNTLSPANENVTTMLIRVERNVNPPVFSPLIYRENISEHSPLGFGVVTVNATDKDQATGLIYETIGDGSAQSFFSLHPLSGLVFVSRKLTTDPIRDKQYVLRVTAKDQGKVSRTATAMVYITVFRNEHDPRFLNTSYETTIPDTYPLGENVIQILATDDDNKNSPNGQIVYEIIGSVQASSKFQISSTGSISLKDTLIGTGVNRYQIQVKVSDHGSPPRSVSTVAVVNVIRGREAPICNPQPAKYFVTKPETTPIDSYIYTINCTDPKPVGPTKYEIVGDGLATVLFKINPSTGVITTKNTLVLDSSIFYIIQVVASDSGAPLERTAAKVTVTITRNANKPLCRPKQYERTITDAQPLGVNITQVKAFDNDTGNSGLITYEISAASSNPSDSNQWFFINPVTGVISASTLLTQDPNKRSRYDLRIVVKDKGIPPYSDMCSVRINVLRNSNAPSFTLQHYEVTINESIPLNTTIIDVNAVDPDGKAVTYRMIPGSVADNVFSIDPNDGKIRNKLHVSLTTTNNFNFLVEAKDAGTPARTSTANCIINVLRNPHPPHFDQEIYNVTIPEHQPLGSLVITVSATDKDPSTSRSGDLSYQMIGSSPTNDATSFFMVGQKSGSIFIAEQPYKDPSRPKRPYFTMKVIASDGAILSQSAEALVNVNIIRNNYPPVFLNESYYDKVKDSIGYGRTIINATATDLDAVLYPETPNAKIVYSIDPTNLLANQFFQISPSLGLISVRQPLTNGRNTLRYEFQIRAHDGGDPSLFDIANVTIDVEQTSPKGQVLGFILPNYWAEVKENSNVGTSVLDLDVLYQFPDLKVDCYFADGTEDVRFKLERSKTTGKDCTLLTNGDIDRETKDRYVFMVGVRHHAAITRRKRSMTNGIWSLLGKSPAIKEEKVLSRQKRQSYRSFNPAKIIVTVIDVNDNVPQFIYPEYPYQKNVTKKMFFGAIDHNARPNSKVNLIEAYDPDLGNNSKFFFCMGERERQLPRNTPFNIDRTSGIIYNTREFDQIHNASGLYQFGICVDDYPLPSDKSNADVYVNLIDDTHRMIMIIPDETPDKIIIKAEAIRRKLQQLTNKVILIEKIENKRDKTGNSITTDYKGTDLYFVSVNPKTKLICTSKQNEELILGNRAQQNIRDDLLGIVTERRIRRPYVLGGAPGQARSLIIYKTYYYLFDSDLWPALVALACIIILLSIVGIVIICFTWSRYKRYVERYNKLYVAPQYNPVFFSPPSMIAPTTYKDFEVQSLNMFIPPDDTAADLGEVNLGFAVDSNGQPLQSSDVHLGAINPIYDNRTAVIGKPSITVTPSQ
ncbi:protocadherin Fat 4-like [Tubulanus polymorphus]|uniref:protocadherin Fat 4-like n=1 Tax=Tubulanus polymorphus TaxID=672921 RepID=UPI003DA65792